MTSPAAGDTDAPECCLRQVWRELTRRGFAMDEPSAVTSMCFIDGLRGAQCALDLLVGGALVWEFIPLGGTVIPGQIARVVWALLGGGAGPASCAQSPAQRGGVGVREVAGRVLAGRGLAVRQAQAGGEGDAWPVTVVTSPAQPARGDVCIGHEGDLRWGCCFARPAGPPGGMAPATVARLIAAALAGQRAIEHDAAGCSLPRPQDLGTWAIPGHTTTRR